MTEVSSNELQSGVESLHSCRARLVETTVVREVFRGQAAWEGVVHVFDLEDHPIATRAYAWSSLIEGSEKRRFYAVLHVPPISSAADAVRAAIVADYRQGQSPAAAT